MATYYVRHLATGANNGTSWTNAYTSFNSALALVSGGDTLYIADDHVETVQALRMPNSASFGSPIRVIGVNTNSVMPPSGGAPLVGSGPRPVITFNTVNGHLRRIEGCAYFYGIDFKVPAVPGRKVFLASQVTPYTALTFENCLWELRDSIHYATNSYAASEIIFSGCTFDLGAPQSAGEIANGAVKVIFRGLKVVRTGISTSPAVIADTTPNSAGRIEYSGSDFSLAKMPDNSLFWIAHPGSGPTLTTFHGCKFGINQSIYSHNPGITRPKGGVVGISYDFDGSPSTPENFVGTHFSHYFARQRSTYVSSWPQSLSSSGKPISYELGTLASVDPSGLVTHGPWNGFWNDVVGTPITLTIPVYTFYALNKASVWVECFYRGDAASSRYSCITSRGAGLFKGANVGETTAGYDVNNVYTPDTTTAWVTNNTQLLGVNGKKSTITVTFTPQARGWVRYRLNSVYTNVSYYAPASYHTHPLIS